jgi:hypothetical protein
MSSALVKTKHSAEATKELAATPIVHVPQTVRVDTAANDDSATSTFAVAGDPLFGMAMASGILFAVLAVLIAFS